MALRRKPRKDKKLDLNFIKFTYTNTSVRRRHEMALKEKKECSRCRNPVRTIKCYTGTSKMDRNWRS